MYGIYTNYLSTPLYRLISELGTPLHLNGTTNMDNTKTCISKYVIKTIPPRTFVYIYR